MPDHDDRSIVQDDRERAMMREISQVIRDKSEYQAAARQIEEIERRYLAAAEGDERVTIQQLAAREILLAATDIGGSLEDIYTRFDMVCEVGFSSTQTELSVLIDLAYACGAHGRWEEGLRVLAQARARLPDWRFKHPAMAVGMLDGLQERLEKKDIE